MYKTPEWIRLCTDADALIGPQQEVRSLPEAVLFTPTEDWLRMVAEPMGKPPPYTAKDMSDRKSSRPTLCSACRKQLNQNDRKESIQPQVELDDLSLDNVDSSLCSQGDDCSDRFQTRTPRVPEIDPTQDASSLTSLIDVNLLIPQVDAELLARRTPQTPAKAQRVRRAASEPRVFCSSLSGTGSETESDFDMIKSRGKQKSPSLSISKESTSTLIVPDSPKMAEHEKVLAEWKEEYGPEEDEQISPSLPKTETTTEKVSTIISDPDMLLTRSTRKRKQSALICIDSSPESVKERRTTVAPPPKEVPRTLRTTAKRIIQPRKVQQTGLRPPPKVPPTRSVIMNMPSRAKPSTKDDSTVSTETVLQTESSWNGRSRTETTDPTITDTHDDTLSIIEETTVQSKTDTVPTDKKTESSIVISTPSDSSESEAWKNSKEKSFGINEISSDISMSEGITQKSRTSSRLASRSKTRSESTQRARSGSKAKSAVSHYTLRNTGKKAITTPEEPTPISPKRLRSRSTSKGLDQTEVARPSTSPCDNGSEEDEEDEVEDEEDREDNEQEEDIVEESPISKNVQNTFVKSLPISNVLSSPPASIRYVSTH